MIFFIDLGKNLLRSDCAYLERPEIELEKTSAASRRQNPGTLYESQYLWKSPSKKRQTYILGQFPDLPFIFPAP